jgi:opacity protein-like surface antigen
MIRKLLIAASAVAVLATAAASQASAKVHVNVLVGGGYPVYAQPYPVYPAYPVYDDGYDSYDDGDCGYEYINVKKWNRYHDRYRIVHKRVWVCN